MADKFFTCLVRKNKPRVTIRICRKCKLHKSCTQFRDYIQPSLFEVLSLPGVSPGKRR